MILMNVKILICLTNNFSILLIFLSYFPKSTLYFPETSGNVHRVLTFVFFMFKQKFLAKVLFEKVFVTFEETKISTSYITVFTLIFRNNSKFGRSTSML